MADFDICNYLQRLHFTILIDRMLADSNRLPLGNRAALIYTSVFINY